MIYSHVNFVEPCESEAGAKEYTDLWIAVIAALNKEFDVFIRSAPRIEEDKAFGDASSAWIAKTRFSFGPKQV